MSIITEFSLSDDDDLIQQPVVVEAAPVKKTDKKSRPKAVKNSNAGGGVKKSCAPPPLNIKSANTAILKRIVEIADKRDWDNNIKEFLKCYRFTLNPATISTELAVKLAKNELERSKRAPEKAQVSE